MSNSICDNLIWTSHSTINELFFNNRNYFCDWKIWPSNQVKLYIYFLVCFFSISTNSELNCKTKFPISIRFLLNFLNIELIIFLPGGCCCSSFCSTKCSSFCFLSKSYVHLTWLKTSQILAQIFDSLWCLITAFQIGLNEEIFYLTHSLDLFSNRFSPILQFSFSKFCLFYFFAWSKVGRIVKSVSSAIYRRASKKSSKKQ